ncbi:MAG: thioredoxin domain-containing protein [bacterium]
MPAKISFALGILGAVAVVVLVFLFQAGDFDFSFLDFSNRIEVARSTQVNSAVTIVTAADHVRGAEDPKIIWIEYGDFECTSCEEFYLTGKNILFNYSDSVLFVYRHYPFPTHPGAEMKAVAAECAGELAGEEAFWLFHDLIFELTASGAGGLSVTELLPIAVELGFDREDFSKCLYSDRYEDRITQDLIIGIEGGVQGTPTSFVIGPDGEVTIISGAISYSAASSLIEELLAGSQNSQ